MNDLSVRIRRSHRSSTHTNLWQRINVVKKLFTRPVRGVLAALLAVFDLTPFVFLVPVPPTDSWTIGALIFICVVSGYWAWLAFKSATPKQRAVLPLLAVVAMLNVLTQICMTHLPSTLQDRVPYGFIASLFGLDGEYAYNAALFEVWCQLWLCLALIACAIGWTVRRAVLTKAGSRAGQ